MDPADKPTGTGTTGVGATIGQTGTGQGDMLDKGVNALEQKSGHAQKAGTTEKARISTRVVLIR